MIRHTITAIFLVEHRRQRRTRDRHPRDSARLVQKRVGRRLGHAGMLDRACLQRAAQPRKRLPTLTAVGPRLDTLYSAIEMLESGTTTVHHINSGLAGPPENWDTTTDAILSAYDEIGMRVSYSFMMRDRNVLSYDDDTHLLAALPDDLSDWIAPQLAAPTRPPRPQSGPDHRWQGAGGSGRTGSAPRWRGRRPVVRGVAMNPVDPPLGGGEGRTSGGRHPVTPWGKPTKGKKTRTNRSSDKFIVRSRHQRKKK